MITLIKKNPAHALVKESVQTIDVSVSLNPQSAPLELHFASEDDALKFIARCTAEDGEQYVVSLLSYNQPQQG